MASIENGAKSITPLLCRGDAVLCLTARMGSLSNEQIEDLGFVFYRDTEENTPRSLAGAADIAGLINKSNRGIFDGDPVLNYLGLKYSDKELNLPKEDEIGRRPYNSLADFLAGVGYGRPIKLDLMKPRIGNLIRFNENGEFSKFTVTSRGMQHVSSLYDMFRHVLEWERHNGFLIVANQTSSQLVEPGWVEPSFSERVSSALKGMFPSIHQIGRF